MLWPSISQYTMRMRHSRRSLVFSSGKAILLLRYSASDVTMRSSSCWSEKRRGERKEGRRWEGWGKREWEGWGEREWEGVGEREWEGWGEREWGDTPNGSGS